MQKVGCFLFGLNDLFNANKGYDTPSFHIIDTNATSIYDKECHKMSNHRQTTHCIELFVCLGLTSLLNIWGHIVTEPACSSGTLTNVLPHRNAMLQTQDMTPHSLTLYGHGADLSLCYPLMWNVTLEYTATHFNGLGKTRPGNPSPTFFTPANVQLYDAVMGVISRELSSKYCTNRVLNPEPVVWESITA